MSRVIRWFAVNRVAANLLAAFILVAGFMAVPKIRREVFPEFDSNWVLVQVAYPGAAPAEVEEGICVKIEDAVQGLQGVKQVVSTASEGLGVVSVELLPRTNSGRLLDEVKQKVDALETLPEESDKPTITELIIRKQVINVAVSGEVGEKALKRAGERVRDELLALPGITQVELANTRPYEIAIEIPEAQLRRFGLTFDEVAAAVRKSSLDLPGGTIKTESGEILLRVKGQAYRAGDYRDITLRVNPDGSRLILGQVALVRDGFADTDLSSRFNGKPAVLVRVFRVGEQSALEIAGIARDYVEGARHLMPEGVDLETWQDDSSYLRGRLDLLMRNGQAGLALVFLILAMFLRFRLAIWVTFGIPVSFMGTLWLMPTMDVSISLISLFAFIVVLGIVVDDAIVLGENIYTHQNRNGGGLESTVAGATEVARPVIFGVLTTVVAFYPLLAIEGNTGKILRFIPLIVMPTLLFSLVECLFILPAHLRDLPTVKPAQPGFWSRFQQGFAQGAERFVLFVYQPFLEWCLRWRYLTVATGVALLCLTIASYVGGHVRFVFFPPVEGDNVFAYVTFPRGTSAEKTAEAAKRLEVAAGQVRQQIVSSHSEGTNIFRQMLTTVGMQPYRMEAEFAGGNYEATHFGSHKAEVHIEVAPSEERAITSQAIADQWRKATGEMAGASEIGFSASIFSTGKPISVRLSGPNLDELLAATEKLKAKLAEYPGVQDVSDSIKLGKREMELRIKSEAEALGLTQADLARQVRQAFYGEEAQRIQRHRDDVKVMVRYPDSDRRSPEDLRGLRIRLKGGREVPFGEVAEVAHGRGFASIKRIDGRRSVKITADIDISQTEPDKVVAGLREDVMPEIMEAHPGVMADFKGAREEQELAMASLIQAYFVAMIMIYALLAIPFKSYVQPFIVMCAIPFGLIGAVLGHLIMGMELTILSMFGVVALTGVVVNDSLVMVDFVNRNRLKYTDLIDAVRVSGVARFRAIWLTSLTTFAGLTPLVFFEKSVQAQFLVPMAISLGFGVMFATTVTLVLVPALYVILEDLRDVWQWLYGPRTDEASTLGGLATMGR
ncbi:MAG: acriflavin resistance protein [Verrucomicrobiales bacterium]|nr:acriflavin resistance protein [Verrucomicrobiales bacterium]|tara:strand:+ start:57207 stop:60407 length:3201 start_codon:yes stop_codon:yes gene_type:complete